MMHQQQITATQRQLQVLLMQQEQTLLLHATELTESLVQQLHSRKQAQQTRFVFATVHLLQLVRSQSSTLLVELQELL
jgi:hypothetical protein